MSVSTERSGLQAIFACIPALYLLIVVLSCVGWPVGAYDEAITLFQGRMVAQGYKPFADFWSFYPPLNYYLNAGMFLLLGSTFLAQRLLQAAFYVLVVASASVFFRHHLSSRMTSSVATLLVAASIGPMFLLAPWIGFSLAVLALLAYFTSHRSPRNRTWWILMAGILAGLSILSRINFGVYAAAAIGLDLILFLLITPDSASGRQYKRVGSWRPPVVFAISLLTCCIGIFLLLCGPNLDLAIEQSVAYQQRAMVLRFIPPLVTPAWGYTIMFPCAWFAIRMIIGRAHLTRRMLIPLICAVTILVLAWLRINNPRLPIDVTVAEIVTVLSLHLLVFRLERTELSLLIFYSCLLHYYLSRADSSHWALLLPVVALLSVFIFCPRPSVSGETAVSDLPLGSALALLALFVGIVVCIPGSRPSGLITGCKLILNGGFMHRLSDSQQVFAGRVPAKPWRLVYADSDEVQAVRFVRERTSRSDAVFVTTEDETEPFAVDVRAYWLLDRPVISRYYIFDTYLTRQPAIQQAIVDEMQRNQLKWIILEHDPPTDDTFRQHKSNGSDILDSFITSTYAQVAKFGRYSVLSR